MRIPSGLGLKRRKAVAALFAGLLIFGLIFTVGMGYFLYQNQLSLSSSQAASDRQASNLQAEREHLSLAVKPQTGGQYNNWLFVEASNVGGIASIITAVFVTNGAGQILTHSTGGSDSQYLTGKPDLSVMLPISLGVGLNTTSMNSCGAPLGCSPGINTTAFRYIGVPVWVNVLTSSGDVFSVAYPPQSQSANVTRTVGSSALTISNGTTKTINGTSTSTIILTTASSTGFGFGIGTNSLEVSLKACAGYQPPTAFSNNCAYGATTVYNGGEVVLRANVTNLASVGMNVFVNFQGVATNGASLSTSGPAYPTYCSPSPASSVTISGTTNTTTIAAGKTGYFDCTFSANTGTSNSGAVTFVGFAVGTYTLSPAPPVTIYSAESTSNTLQLGNPLTIIAGPWLMNYFSFDYASSTSTSWQSAAFVSHSLQKVMFQAQFTNTASSALTILGYSYILVGRIQQEMDYYAVSGTTYSTSLSPYACANTGTGGAPTGSSCSAVPVGSTVTVDFAACAPYPNTGDNSFMWANSNGGNSACSSNKAGWNAPEGAVMFAVIVYEYQSGGNWITFSQSVPAQGIFVS